MRIILQIQKKEKKRKMATILKLAIKNIYPNYQHYTDIDPNVNTRPSKGLSLTVLAIGSSRHRGRVIIERKKSGSDPGSFIML
jgi:hypothetical protein